MFYNDHLRLSSFEIEGRKITSLVRSLYVLLLLPIINAEQWSYNDIYFIMKYK